jgi:glucose/arabinose dehydrogenase
MVRVTLLLVAAGACAAALPAGMPASPRAASVTDSDCRAGLPSRTIAPGLRASRSPAFRLRVVARGLVQPVYVAATPAQPRRLYVVEKAGRVRVLAEGRVLPRPFLDIRAAVRARGEEGLLSLAFHPRYASTRLVYAAFNDRRGDVNVVEYRTNGERALPSTARRVYLVDKLAGVTWHNGGQLQFGPDGRLYLSTGDSAHTPLDDEPALVTDPDNHAQTLSSPYGKLLRLDVGSAVPPEVIAYGLRNPWRFSFDPATGAIYLGDVGFHIWEEINVVRTPGRGLVNFGWSACEGNEAFVDRDADPADQRPRDLLGPGAVHPPLIQYAHPRAGYCNARGTVIGGYVYRASALRRLRGRYVFGDWCSGEIWSARVGAGAAGDVRLERRGVGRPTAFGRGNRGELYVTTLEGRVLRLDPP